jgi:hypothetical protein
MGILDRKVSIAVPLLLFVLLIMSSAVYLIDATQGYVITRPLLLNLYEKTPDVLFTVIEFHYRPASHRYDKCVYNITNKGEADMNVKIEISMFGLGGERVATGKAESLSLDVDDYRLEAIFFEWVEGKSLRDVYEYEIILQEVVS